MGGHRPEFRNALNLTHHFLLSMPQMEDPNFKHTLTYLIEHGEHGALGFIINRKIGIDLGEVFQQMELDPEAGADVTAPVFEGGPVDQEHGLILHPSGQTWQSSKDFGHGVSLSSSRDILEDMAIGLGPTKSMVLLGHSGWAPGQLESELAQNAWLTCQADQDIMFELETDLRLTAAAELLGVNLNTIVSDAGHA